MKLKRVKIVGFKTFADRTEFELDGDVIAVVGPNGCGKSNIVDAVLWGLGESNARHLRAQTSQEVIFSGSLRRKPQSYAEVTLVFDNEDGALPLDSPEVAITRRLNRAGESEYAINRRPCRLRDVTELLADSGLGRAGYAIVGQSDIDQALAASAVQRRAWIDEAAGVQRYRMRRVEALRKLEQCALHLERVSDIVAEIESQREPLRAEAEVAKRYKSVQASLREIEVGLLVREYEESSQDVQQQSERIDSVLKLIDDLSGQMAEHEASAAVAAETATQLDGEVDRLREVQLRVQGALEAAKTKLEVSQSKLEGLDTLERSLFEEGEQAGNRLQEIQRDLDQARVDAETEAKARDELRLSLAGAGEEAKTLSSQLDRLNKELTLARSAAEALHKARIEVAHRQERLEQIERELAGIGETLPELNEGLAEASAQVREIDAQIAETESASQSLDAKIQAGKQQDHHLQQQTRGLLSQLATLEGRRRAAEQTLASHEGLAQGARAVLNLVEKGELPDVFVPVSQAIEAESDLALAIDTALAGAANDLIVPDEWTAKDAIDRLKRDRLGRATFQPLNLVRPQSPPRELETVLGQPGVVGLASRLVWCEDDFRPVIDSLLGRIVVVEDLEAGLKLARTGGWSRLVTLDGEVVFSSGAVTGGVQARSSQGNVQRKAELNELIHQANQVQSEIEDLALQAENLEEERRGWDSEREALHMQRANLRKTRDEAATWLAGLKHEWLTTERSQERLSTEKTRLTQDLPVLGEAPDIATLEAARDALLKEFSAKSVDADRAKDALREAESRANLAQQRYKELGRRLESAVEAEKHREHKKNHLAPERAKLQAAINHSRQEIEALGQKLEAHRVEVLAAQQSRAESLAKVRQLEEQVRELQKGIQGLNETLHKAELARARAEGKRTASTERLLEEYGLTPEEAGHPEIPADASTVVSRLRKDLKEMGEVNLGAVEAYDRLNARHQELTGQAEDILAGKIEVQTSIKELDRLTRDRFLTTFQALQTAFATSFKQIFGDGEGSLELADEQNVLDSGVEISVQVPGKKRQRLELLSGGERALSAMAFLFALIRVKPTPLVVLDEIDAPLDGRNVERFIGVMRELSQSVQFILITHNPVTIESADVWFGVTMQEPGVSTLVPVKAPDRGIMRAVVPDAYLKG